MVFCSICSVLVQDERDEVRTAHDIRDRGRGGGELLDPHRPLQRGLPRALGTGEAEKTLLSHPAVDVAGECVLPVYAGGARRHLLGHEAAHAPHQLGVLRFRICRHPVSSSDPPHRNCTSTSLAASLKSGTNPSSSCIEYLNVRVATLSAAAGRSWRPITGTPTALTPSSCSSSFVAYPRSLARRSSSRSSSVSVMVRRRQPLQTQAREDLLPLFLRQEGQQALAERRVVGRPPRPRRAPDLGQVLALGPLDVEYVIA